MFYIQTVFYKKSFKFQYNLNITLIGLYPKFLDSVLPQYRGRSAEKYIDILFFNAIETFI